MSTQPSEHAMRAAKVVDCNLYISAEARAAMQRAIAAAIDQHAIAPAVEEREQQLQAKARELASQIGYLAEAEAKLAERDKRIAELVDALEHIKGTTMSHVANYEHGFERCRTIAKTILAKHGGAHE